ncbi:hypothetical protein [Bradyrhizobium sp. USDA 3364]
MAAPTHLQLEDSNHDGVHLRGALIAKAIRAIASELDRKPKQTPGPIDAQVERPAMAQIDRLNRELERLLEIKRRLRAQQR